MDRDVLNGVIIAGHSSNPALRPGASVADRDSIREVVVEDKPAIGHPLIGRYSRQPRIPITVPVHGVNGAVVAALRTSIASSDPDLFGKLNHAKIGSSGRFVVMSPSDRLIVAGTDRLKSWSRCRHEASIE